MGFLSKIIFYGIEPKASPQARKSADPHSNPEQATPRPENHGHEPNSSALLSAVQGWLNATQGAGGGDLCAQREGCEVALPSIERQEPLKSQALLMERAFLIDQARALQSHAQSVYSLYVSAFEDFAKESTTPCGGRESKKTQALLKEREFFIEQSRILQNHVQTIYRLYASLFDCVATCHVTDESVKHHLGLVVEELQKPLTSVEAVRALIASYDGLTQGRYTSRLQSGDV